MMRRAHWLAAVGSTTLGLAGLAGCQSMGGYPSGSWSGERSMVRAAEPDDPSGPSLQFSPIQSPYADPAHADDDDPFAPITVEQFLPATSAGPRSANSPAARSQTAPAGYLSTAAPNPPNPIVPPAPMAVMSPGIASPMNMGDQPLDEH